MKSSHKEKASNTNSEDVVRWITDPTFPLFHFIFSSSQRQIIPTNALVLVPFAPNDFLDGFKASFLVHNHSQLRKESSNWKKYLSSKTKAKRKGSKKKIKIKRKKAKKHSKGFKFRIESQRAYSKRKSNMATNPLSKYS